MPLPKGPRMPTLVPACIARQHLGEHAHLADAQLEDARCGGRRGDAERRLAHAEYGDLDELAGLVAQFAPVGQLHRVEGFQVGQLADCP